MSGAEIEKGTSLTVKQRAVLVALVGERTITAAAKKAHVAKSSVYRWLQDPQFRAEVSQTRRRFFEEAIEILVAGQAKAVGRMMEALDSKDQGLRLRAATSIISFGLDVNEGATMEARLSELEERAASMTGAGGLSIKKLKDSMSGIDD